jgi:hypothetical protein
VTHKLAKVVWSVFLHPREVIFHIHSRHFIRVWAGGRHSGTSHSLDSVYDSMSSAKTSLLAHALLELQRESSNDIPYCG